MRFVRCTGVHGGCAQAWKEGVMAAIPVTTRLSRAAVASLRARAKRAGLGTSAYASRLLEEELLGEDRLAATENIPRAVQEALALEVLFFAKAFERVIERQRVSVLETRHWAKGRLRELVAARRSREPPPGPSSLTEQERRQLLEDLTGEEG
jgi:hypothetical protein